jgi:ABC-type nitrate/sulfonate/bicarbonate transport system substrate-binding protein
VRPIFLSVVLSGLLAVPAAADDKVRVMFDWIPTGWHSAWYLGMKKMAASRSKI